MPVRRQLIGILIPLLLGGCSATAVYDRPAPVEDRSRPGRGGERPTKPSAPIASPVPLPEPVEGPVSVPPPSPPPTATPTPSESPPAPTTIALAQPPTPAHPAVGNLLSQATQQARGGELDQASASLERALRIEPNNPWIWHQLAVVRLLQHQDEQATQMAARSNALTGDRALQARNWRVVAQARERLGDTAGASAAATRARQAAAP